MNTVLPPVVTGQAGQPRSVTIAMAQRFGMEPGPFEQVLRATVIPKNCTREQFVAFLMIANKYNLDPIAREIYAFPKPDGGIQPIVGIDGWLRMINDNPQMNGLEFEDILDETGKLMAVKCRIYRKDRDRPTEVVEYMKECFMDKTTWKKWPARMLRHKATIQCARYAFSLSGIVDPDEYERFAETKVLKSQSPTRADLPPPSNAVTAALDRFAVKETQDPETGEIQTEEGEGQEATEKAQEGQEAQEREDSRPAADTAMQSAYEAGQEAYGKNTGRAMWPSRLKDRKLIEIWQAGWDTAQAEREQ